MGLDVGTKTVGIAISDALGWTAQGIETIQIDENAGHFGIKQIRKLVAEYQVSSFRSWFSEKHEQYNRSKRRGV